MIPALKKEASYCRYLDNPRIYANHVDGVERIAHAASNQDMITAALTQGETTPPNCSTNGGPNPEDIDIRLDAPDDVAPAFVQSYLGDGPLTFYTGYQFQTEAPYSLWVRGPEQPPQGRPLCSQIRTLRISA